MDQKAPRTYSLPDRPRWPILVILLVTLTVAAGCVFSVLCIRDYAVNQAKDSALSEEAALTARGAEAASPVDLATPLRKDAVDEVLKAETIPAYTYDQCWDMDVSQPSGVTLADLKLVSRGAFVGIEDAFLKAEQDYGVNCLFVMGIASLECANGTICYRPNNMFGFGGKSATWPVTIPSSAQATTPSWRS